MKTVFVLIFFVAPLALAQISKVTEVDVQRVLLTLPSGEYSGHVMSLMGEVGGPCKLVVSPAIENDGSYEAIVNLPGSSAKPLEFRLSVGDSGSVYSEMYLGKIPRFIATVFGEPSGRRQMQVYAYPTGDFRMQIDRDYKDDYRGRICHISPVH